MRFDPLLHTTIPLSLYMPWTESLLHKTLHTCFAPCLYNLKWNTKWKVNFRHITVITQDRSYIVLSLSSLSSCLLSFSLIGGRISQQVIRSHILLQALKYRSVMDIVRPIRQIVRRREETTGHSVRPKWTWGLFSVRPEWIGVRPNCSFVQIKMYPSPGLEARML
jgi:hypothetical protein